MVKKFITQVARRRGLEPNTVEGFRVVLRDLRARDFQGKLDAWGRRPIALLRDAYKNSSIQAVLDLVKHDPDFAVIRSIGVNPYDFHRCRCGYWTNQKNGRIGPGSRLVAERLLEVVAGPERALSLHKRGVFVEVAQKLLQRSSYSIPLNEWGTTALRCYRHGYNSNALALVRDLVRVDGRYGYAAPWLAEILQSSAIPARQPHETVRVAEQSDRKSRSGRVQRR